DRGIELAEERLRLAQLLTGLELRRRPCSGPCSVVASQRVVGRAVGLPHGPSFRRSGDDAIMTQIFVELLAGEGEERREHHLEVVDAAERDVEHGPGALAVARDRLPGLVRGEVL